MVVDILKEWVLVISASATMLSISVGIWLSLKEYRLKLQVETRLKRSADIESEVRLQTLFISLMQVAHSRSGYVLSEKAVEKYLEKMDPIEFKNLHKLNHKLHDLAILNYPVGSAEQEAAISAIAKLTIKYRPLREIGIQALDSLEKGIGIPVTKEYNDKVKSKIKEIREMEKRKGIYSYS
jgi:hypothetical protein